MGEEKQFHRRSGILIGLFVLVLLWYALILYNNQVVNYEDHLSRSSTQVTTTETVEAHRGVVTDRNGKVLVSSKEIYTINFDPDRVEKENDVDQDVDVAKALLRFLRLCQDHGIAWPDNLPISTTQPYSYTISDLSDTQRSRFQRFLKKMGWSNSELSAETTAPTMTDTLRIELLAVNNTLSAEKLMALLREKFGIPESFTNTEARLVCGVLYELELRVLDPNYYVPPYEFARDVSVELISILNDGDFQGVVVGSESERQYNTEYAAHILGRIADIDSKEERDELNAPYLAAQAAGEDTSSLHYYAMDDKVGKQGVERAFESYLRGKDGKRVITTNEEGKITSELYSTQPEPGDTVALTIDIDFQAEVEKALAATVEAMNAEDGSESRGAAAAVVSVEDSGVLALASYPTFSLANYGKEYNTYLADPGKPLQNRAISGTYAPGSTFKMVTSVAALESGIVTPTSEIRTRGKYTYWSDYQPACWIYNQSRGNHGSINVSEAIFHSCNYFYYEVGRLMGIDTLNQYATDFGLGQSTGLELGGAVGVLDSPEYRSANGDYWVGGNVLQCAIGQGDNLFSPLQLANYTATLVRGGQRYDTHLLESVAAYDGSETLYDYEPETVAAVQMKDSTLAAVKKGMGDLVNSGSISRYFQNCIVSAGAKTGSAQTGAKVANGVFVCFAPFDEPEIAVAIVIEQGGSGAALASTAVEIINAYFSPSEIGTVMVPEGSLLP